MNQCDRRRISDYAQGDTAVRAQNAIAAILADMVYDTSHGNPWHGLAEATSDLEAKDLKYKPVPTIGCDWGQEDRWPRRRILTPRHILLHVAGAAEAYGDHLAPRTRRKCEAEWDAFTWRQPFDTPESVVHAVDIACRRLHARATKVTDAELPQPCGMWGKHNAAKLLVLIDGGILHPAWHFGQVAMLTAWRRAQQKERIAKPTVPPAGEPIYPGRRDWSDCHVRSRTEACLRLLHAAYRESPWHAVRGMVQGLTAAEAWWRPFPAVESPWTCPAIAMPMAHVAACKVMYADHGVGTRKFDWPDCDAVLGCDVWSKPGPRKLLAALDRAQEFLTEHVAAASDGELDRVNAMHHGKRLKGWQVVASMAQHDAWHAGQISIIRDAYAALAQQAA